MKLLECPFCSSTDWHICSENAECECDDCGCIFQPSMDGENVNYRIMRLPDEYRDDDTPETFKMRFKMKDEELTTLERIERLENIVDKICSSICARYRRRTDNARENALFARGGIFHCRTSGCIIHR